MTILSSEVVVLVKALPQPSKKYGETVCCAGITRDGKWQRLFPVRFRHLQGDSSFGRWDWVKFRYQNPKQDTRIESCHVFEDSIIVVGKLAEKERARILTPLIVASGKHAADLGQSLALIRPRNTRFTWKEKSKADIAEERDALAKAARQTSMFDEELAQLIPSPFEFRFKFEDGSGAHDYQNGDWEAHAMFWAQSNRSNTKQALEWMDHTFNVAYPEKGMAFAIGNQAKRPQTWQLLGVIRLDEVTQSELF